MPSLFKKKSKSNINLDVENLSHEELKSLFILILLSDQELQTALVSKNHDLKGLSPIRNYFDEEDLAVQLDQALQDLGPAADEVADCVFAFDQEWLKDGELIAVKKVIVQELSERLSLQVLGQLSMIEGIHQSRTAIDPHDSSLFLYLREQSFDLLLIKHGQLLTNLSVGRSGNIAADFKEGLARISQDLGEEGKYFPNKVFLTNLKAEQKALRKQQEELSAFDWTSVSSFLQIPQFEVLENNYLIKALSGVASLSLSPKTKEQLAEAGSDKKAIEEQVTAEDNNLQAAPIATSFGIEFGDHQSSDSKKDLKEQQQTKKKVKTKKNTALARFWRKNQRALLIGIGSGLLALIVLVSIFSVFLSKIKVKIKPAEKFLQKELTITLDPSLAESDFEKYNLKANLVTKDITGEDVANTSGKSKVGEKAKGQVKLFNKTSAEKTFDAGTELSTDDYVFVLENEVTVPAALEDEDGGGIDYGVAETEIVAQDIGAEYNLNKDTKLRIADYYDDTYAATIVDNLSGGSSREVQVVSAQDMNLLAGKLKEALAKLATEEFTQESTDGVYLVPTGNSKTIDFAYDQEEGAEVDSLSLTMTLQFEAIKYLSTDLRQLAEAALAKDLPENYVFIDEEPSLMSDAAQASADDPGTLLLKAELSAKAAANLDEAAIKNSLLGQDQAQALSILQNNELIQEAEIVFQPAFMANLLKRLPTSADRLELIIE